MAKREVAVKKEEPTSLILVQDQVPDYLLNAKGRGSENVTMEDMVIPRLEIVQGLSPAVKRGDPGFIQGAQMGMMNNSVTRKLYGDAAFVIPVYYTKQWSVWRKRKDEDGKSQEGGFFGSYNTPEEAQNRADQEGDPSIEIIDTPQHLCLVLDEETGDIEEIMVSMARTKAKVSRKWNSMVKLAGGDRFSRVYKLGTVLEKNSQGDFYNFDVKLLGFPSQMLFKKAEELYNSVTLGGRKVVMDVSGLDESSGRGQVADDGEM